jgi:NADPH-dependent glutamate synthase beta subunit-like oxidoreductase/Pyruvate/2-oxoacid:ferredoxin oxidoreductase delta subunit
MTAELVVAEAAPCTAACPAGVNVQGYVGLIAQGRFSEALDLVRTALPFPGICGRVCPAPCEAACQRAPHGGGVAIRALKRFIADAGRESSEFGWSMPPVSCPEKIAVVGAGPAGLTAALDLRRYGYAVTIFEARGELGGMLTACLPSFRLPRDISRGEIESIASLDGIHVESGVRIGRDVALPELLKQGYDAILVAIGAHRPLKLGVPDDDADGVIDAIDFLSSNAQDAVRGRVLVVGGGSTAMDAARTALRLGCEEARVVYRRTLLEMPAAHEEVEHALQEGVVIQTLTAPSHVLVRDGRAIGLRCDRTRLGDPDESGRRRPVVIPDSGIDLAADCIIAAIGQEPDPTTFTQAPELTDRKGRVKADPDTLQTASEQIFSAGDAVTGPATIIGAVGQAHRAAGAIHRFLRTGSARAADNGDESSLWQVASSRRDFRSRILLPLRGAEERRHNFDEVELPLNADAVVAEASRCLRCGSCSACQICSSACLWRSVSLETNLTAGYLARAERALLPEDSAGARLHLDGIGKALEADALVSLACTVRPAVCRGCGKCAEVCAFDAVRLEAAGVSGTAQLARIDPALCRGCGICVAECPSGAVDAGVMADAVLHERLSGVAQGGKVVFRCQWNRAAPEEGAVEIRVPCAGRVSAGLVAWALAHGAGGVTVATCPESECKYGRGAKLTSDRLEWLLRFEADRVRMG